MGFTFDTTTPIGRIRLLIGDKEQTGALFSDEELDALLALENGNVYLAAANALDIIATDQVMVLKVIKLVGSLETDGAKVAVAIREQASILRGTAMSGNDIAVSVFGVV